jgi:predicted nucleotidyltransferase
VIQFFQVKTMAANSLSSPSAVQLQTLGQRFGIRVLVLFGSVARGTFGEGSDIDIAVLLEKQPEVEKRRQLWAALSQLFSRDVDLTILNHAEPLVSFRVACEGKILFVADDRAWETWKSYAVRQYWDTEKFREALKSYLSRRAEETRNAAAG